MSTKLEKQVRRLLISPAGRKAIKNLTGIELELCKTEEELKQKPIVVVLVPTYRAPHARMSASMNKMIEFTRASGEAVIYSGETVQAGVVHWARNWLITQQLNSGKPWTHALLVDDDMICPEDAVVKMLRHQKDIVSGLCVRRNDPPIPCIRSYDEQTGEYRQIWEWPEDQLFDTGGSAGAAFLLATRQAFEQVTQAYFDCLWEKEHYGVNEEWTAKEKERRIRFFDKTRNCYWFRFLPTAQSVEPIEMGEDTSFCHAARKYCGIPIYCDSSIQPGHLGDYDFGIKDFLPHQSAKVEEAKRKNLYQQPLERPVPISICVPTRKRPERVLSLLESIEKTCTQSLPEVVFYVDDDDDSFPSSLPYHNTKVIRGPRITLSQCWNECAKSATGDILMQAGDDFLFKTKGWDELVMRGFQSFPDRIALIHGDDGHWGDKFGTHCFIHRKWYEIVGYLTPPYFSSDYGDTWLNDVANALNRRICLPFLTEHIHPYFGKREYDQTDKDRLERHEGNASIYKETAPQRIADIVKLKEAIEAYANNDAYQSCL